MWNNTAADVKQHKKSNQKLGVIKIEKTKKK